MKLQISKDGLTLPLEAATSTFGLLAVRGAGKSNAARVMAEEMFKAGLPFVYIDPVGSAYGLRSGRDGKPNGGLPIPIFGGRHGDVPLERGAGEIIADLIVERRLSCVLDVSTLDSETDKKTFLLAFARRLYQKNQDPLHLFLEEADDYIPQKPMRDEAQLLRAWENIVRRGRARGLGCTIITQRSAAVNKMVLTQVETLFVLRTTGPQDIAAIEAWTKYHQVGRELLQSLAGLADGEAWAWSPHFLKTPATRFTFRRCETFDSGATPKNVRGADARKAATLADVDLVDLRGRIAETIERAKADDPKVLRAKIAELEKQLKAKQAPAAPKIVPIFDKDLFDQLQAQTLGMLERIEHAVAEEKQYSTNAFEYYVAGLEGYDKRSTVRVRPPLITDGERIPETTRAAKPVTTNGEAHKLSRCADALLNVIVQRHPKRTNASQLSILSGYTIKSSGFANALSELRTHGLIVGGRNELSATELGVSVKAHSVTPLPSGQNLVSYWVQKLSRCSGELLRAFIESYPDSLTKDEACAQTQSQYSPTSSGVANALSELRTLELIDGYGEMKANQELVS